MPENGPQAEAKQQELGIVLDGADEPRLPPVVPPRTSAPFHFNQQVNVQQIPPKVWEKLSSDQIVDLSKAILKQIDDTDSRHFTYAMESAKKSSSVAKLGICVGGTIATMGLALGAYLCSTGHEIVGAILLTFLGTTIAHVVGSRVSRD